MMSEALARAMLSELIDYAGLFPPAQLPLAAAYDEYRRLRGSPHAWMLGRFIVPFSRFRELLDIHGDAPPIPVSVILDEDRASILWLNELAASLDALVGHLHGDARVEIASLEIPVPPLKAARERYGAVLSQVAALLERTGLRHLPCYAEFPRDARWAAEMPDAVSSLARTRLRSKIRCGGLVAEAFPSPAELTALLQCCVESGVAWKATAGLHHPVARRDTATGFEMHGFVNLLVASCIALEGAPFEEIEAVLAERDAGAFAVGESGLSWRGRNCETGSLERARRAGLLSYGSCSVDEPVEDLRSMGWLM
ncbi:MAG: hypothetical protein ACP5O6_07540 [Candidatus Baltobacteraceae bacterium]